MREETEAIILNLIACQKNSPELFDYVFSRHRLPLRRRALLVERCALTPAGWDAIGLRPALAACAAVGIAGDDDTMAKLAGRAELLLNRAAAAVPKERRGVLIVVAYFAALAQNWQNIWGAVIGKMTPSTNRAVHDFRTRCKGRCDAVMLSLLRKALTKTER